MKEDPVTKFETYFKDVDPAELGRMIVEYVGESNHNGWDGFSRYDLTGIRKLLADMQLYHEASIRDFGEDHFRRELVVEEQGGVR